jgi:hypothetical protein
MTLTAEGLVSIAMSNPLNAEIVSRLPSLGVSQCMLTAGCIFQAVWNEQSGQPAAWGISDYDVFYFDEDLSWEAENQVILEASHLFRDLNAKVELRNQARVHLWFSQRFGHHYPRLHSAKDGVDRFLVAATCIGLGVETGEVYAPHGLDELEQGLLRINPNFRQPEMFLKKAESYRARWPWLRIVEPQSAPAP